MPEGSFDHGCAIIDLHLHVKLLSPDVVQVGVASVSN